MVSCQYLLIKVVRPVLGALDEWHRQLAADFDRNSARDCTGCFDS